MSRGRTRHVLYPAPCIRNVTSGSRSSRGDPLRVVVGHPADRVGVRRLRVRQHDRLHHVVARLAVQRRARGRGRSAPLVPAGSNAWQEPQPCSMKTWCPRSAPAAGAAVETAARVDGSSVCRASAGEGGDRHRRPRAGEATGGEDGGSHAACGWWWPPRRGRRANSRTPAAQQQREPGDAARAASGPPSSLVVVPRRRPRRAGRADLRRPERVRLAGDEAVVDLVGPQPGAREGHRRRGRRRACSVALALNVLRARRR